MRLRRDSIFDGKKYEKVFPGDLVLYRGNTFTVNTTHSHRNDGMQVADLIRKADINSNCMKRDVIHVRVNELQIIVENDEAICRQMVHYWDHLDGKEFKTKMDELGIDMEEKP